jgi:hypothetical protein
VGTTCRECNSRSLRMGAAVAQQKEQCLHAPCRPAPAAQANS